MANELAIMEQATRMLAECKTVDEAKDIIDKAAAAALWARKAKLGLEAQNHAAYIKLMAERKAGQILGDLERGQGKGGGGDKRSQSAKKTTSCNAAQSDPSEYAATLESVGATRFDANRWQKAAEIPEEKFQQYVAQTNDSRDEITTTGFLRSASKPHVSQNSGENEWYTPSAYIGAATLTLGLIDLDPASSEAANGVVGASNFFSIEDNGLDQEWIGNVWMNPPYAQPLVAQFCEKMSAEYKAGHTLQAIVLVNNATETAWFQDLAFSCSAICLPRGRVKFWAPDKTTAAPLQGQALLYLGKSPEKFVEVFNGFGICAIL